MPLRMKKVPRGQVLIPDLPVTNGSYAEIELNSGLMIRVTYIEGTIVNYKPALTPVPETLPSVERSQIKNQMDDIADADGNVPHLPICVDVRLNRPLRIKMPPEARGQREYQLGFIRRIYIHNSGEQPTQIGK